MLHVLIGEDDFSVRQALGEIKKGAGDQSALATNTTTLGGQVTMDQVRGVCETIPFLAEKRLVVVEGLLERFEPRNKTDRKKAARQTDQQDECKAIANCLRRIPEFTELVLISGRISNHNPLLRELSAIVPIKSFPLIKAARLRQWIERRVNNAGGSILPQATELLVRFVGSDLWIMANEVDKLILFTGGRRIEEDDIREVVSYAQEVNIFALVDAILEVRVGVAQELMQRLLKQGAVPAYILVMLSRQVNLLVRVRELRNRGKSRNEIQNKLGLTDFLLHKAWEQADKYSPVRLREVYHQLLEADLSIKTGKYDGELALNILIAGLGQRSIASA
jgi:DNA polymerase-3 subunit delta